ncbi:MAG: hypothetical protein R3F65_23600 [bacterium]
MLTAYDFRSRVRALRKLLLAAADLLRPVEEEAVGVPPGGVPDWPAPEAPPESAEAPPESPAESPEVQHLRAEVERARADRRALFDECVDLYGELCHLRRQRHPLTLGAALLGMAVGGAAVWWGRDDGSEE